MDATYNSRIAGHLKSNLASQLWCNTVGPGANCWFGNRYTPLRRHTFGLRWRP